MIISKYTKYFIINNDKNIYSFETCTGDMLSMALTPHSCMVEPVNTYEIYTKCPDKGTGGWEIEYVTSTDKLIKYYPLFDCIISKNDTAGHVTKTFLEEGFRAYLNS